MQTRIVRTELLAFCSLAILVLPACRSGPPPAEYILGSMPEATATSTPATGLPVVQVKRVQLPDYLDRTDILERRGNELVPSRTSRWGERLSVGMTRALTASLAARLPGMLVIATPAGGRPAREVVVDVAAFESRADQRVVLVARWSVADRVSRQTLSSEQTSLVEPIGGAGDRAVVTAMSHAVEDLANRVAAGIERDLRTNVAGAADSGTAQSEADRCAN
jgi:uncharacterized protein